MGRTAPAAANRHIHIESLENLDALRKVEFDNVIFVVGHSDHYNLEKDTLTAGEPTAFDYHVTPLIQAMEQLKHYPIRKWIHFSTVLLYDWARLELPVDEHAPIDPYRTRYLLSKHMAEDACRFYSDRVPTLNIRLANMYGPSRQKRYDLIHLVIMQLLKQKAARVWTTKPRRDFIYVEDAARAVIELLDTDHTGTVNLGTGTATPVSEVIDLLRDLSGYPIHDEDREVDGPKEFRCDMTTINSIIDWKPLHSTEQGVRRTYEMMSKWATG